jgi:hypothetical protein
MKCIARLSASRTLWLSLLPVGLLLGVAAAASATPNYTAFLTNSNFVQNGPSPVFLSSSQEQSGGAHGEGRVSSGSVLTASLETTKAVSGFNNGLFADYSANLAGDYDDILITGPPAASIPVTLHVPFSATFTQSWDSLTLTGPGGFNDFSSLSQSVNCFAELISPGFGLTSERFTLAVDDKNDIATVGISPVNNGISTPAAIQAGPSPGPATSETFGLITVFRNLPLDAGGFVFLNRVQSPITAPDGIFGPGVGFHFEDFVTLRGEMILPGVAQVGVPMRLISSLSARSIALGGFELASAGGIDVMQQFGVPLGGLVFDLPAGYTADSVSLGLADNTVTTLTGNLTIKNDPSSTAIDAGSLTTISGDLDVSDNTSATVINAGSLVTVSGSVDISDNTATTVIGLGSLTTVDGSLDITGNTGTMVINAASLVTVSGSVDISDNGSTTVNLGSITTVSGSLTLETTGSGAFDAGNGQVGGDLDLTTDGYSEVDAMTAAGETAVTMLSGAATMEMVLPEGTFPVGDHVPFSVKRLDRDPADTWGQTPISTLAKYRFDFANTTLDQDATLNFQINLAALDPDAQSALLDLLHANTLLTLAVLGDDPDAELQTFDVCGAGADPSSGCVAVRWLDENGADLEPYGAVDPAVLRFEALVGHFSTYSIVAISAVPEPATLLLWMSAAAICCLRRGGAA